MKHEQRPKIYLHSLEPTTDFKSRAAEQLEGDGLFLLTTVFYIQTNEGAGRKIMRDGMGEKEWSEKRGVRDRNCERGLAFSQEQALKN